MCNEPSHESEDNIPEELREEIFRPNEETNIPVEFELDEHSEHRQALEEFIHTERLRAQAEKDA